MPHDALHHKTNYKETHAKINRDFAIWEKVPGKGRKRAGSRGLFGVRVAQTARTHLLGRHRTGLAARQGTVVGSGLSLTPTYVTGCTGLYVSWYMNVRSTSAPSTYFTR